MSNTGWFKRNAQMGVLVSSQQSDIVVSGDIIYGDSKSGIGIRRVFLRDADVPGTGK